MTKRQGKTEDPIKAHQLKIARDTLRMSCAMVKVMGGMSHTKAAELLGVNVPSGCTCNPQTVTLRQLQGEKYTLIQTDYDLAEVLGYTALLPEERERITGAVVWIGDGDYVEVWLTEDPAYYNLSASYHNLAYYLEG